MVSLFGSTSLARRISQRLRIATGMLVAILVTFTFVLPAGATDPVSKLHLDDGTWVEIANTGTRNASNRLAENTNMSAAGKKQAMEVIFTGAQAAGMLVPTVLVAGDQFFALDSTTEEMIVVEYTGTSYLLPSGSTGFIKWSVPTGNS